MNELTKKLLLAMGLTQAQIDDLATDTPTAKFEELTAAANAHARTLLENDGPFVKSLKDKGKAEVHDQYARAIKKLTGLSEEEIKDKKPEEIVTLTKSKLTEGKDKTLQDLETENVTLKAEVEKYKNEEIPKIKGEVESEKKKLKVQDKLVKKLVGFGELRNPIEVVQAQLGIDFANKYTVELDDKDELVFKNLDGTSIKNAAGTGFLTADEILKDSLSRNKFLAESHADDKNKKKPITPIPGVTTEEKEKTNFPGLDKAEAKIKAYNDKAGAKP